MDMYLADDGAVGCNLQVLLAKGNQEHRVSFVFNYYMYSVCPWAKEQPLFHTPFRPFGQKDCRPFFEPLSSDDKDHTLGSSAHVRIVNPPIDFQSGRAIQLHTPSVVLLVLLVLLGPRGRCSVSGVWCPSQACALILHYPD